MDAVDQAYVDDLVLALEAAEVMAERHGEPVAVLSDFRVVILRLNNEPPVEIVTPKSYRGDSLARYYT